MVCIIVLRADLHDNNLSLGKFTLPYLDVDVVSARNVAALLDRLIALDVRGRLSIVSSHVDDDPTAFRNVPRLFAVRFSLYLRQLFALRVISTASAGVGCEASHRLRHFLQSIQTFSPKYTDGIYPFPSFYVPA